MPHSIPLTDQIPIMIQLRRRKHLPTNLQQPSPHFQRSLPHLPSQQLRRKNRIQQTNIHPLIQEPHSQPIRIGQLLRKEGMEPSAERNLIPHKPTLDVALKPQRMSKRPRRQRRVRQLLKSQLICRTQSAPPGMPTARWSGAGKGAAAWRATRGAHCREGPDLSLRKLGAAGDGHGPKSGAAPQPQPLSDTRLVRMLSMAEWHRHDPLLPVVGDADALQIVLDGVVILAHHDVGSVLRQGVEELCL